MRIVQAGIILLCIGGVASGIWVFLSSRTQVRNERQIVLQAWNEGNYEEVYRLSAEALAEAPLDAFFLTLHGFAAFEQGMAQITDAERRSFLQQTIWSLRKLMAAGSGNAAADGAQIDYVLGKAYYYMGSGYEDEALQYIQAASDGFAASQRPADLPEYLGLSYAAVHQYRESVAAFSEALSQEHLEAGVSDLLLMAMAQSYIALGDDEAARAYLVRCVDTSVDDELRLQARLRLGEIETRAGNEAVAEAQYNAIISEFGENAEARYQLGRIYSVQGDMVKARAEWRRALRADPAHAGARAALGL